MCTEEEKLVSEIQSKLGELLWVLTLCYLYMGVINLLLVPSGFTDACV